MINDRAKSQIPGLGCNVTYVVGNTLLTIWGDGAGHAYELASGSSRRRPWRSDLAWSSDHEKRQPRLYGPRAAILATALLVTLLPSDTVAQVLTPFRYEDRAQRHCPADVVVWLDFKKRKYYSSSQKLYGRGFHGSYVCRQEARRSLYRRSVLGLR